MVRPTRRGNTKSEKAQRPPITFADHTVGQRTAPQDEDGWSVVETRETKKNQRLRKFANKDIPTPPPLPPTADDLKRFHVRENRHQFTPELIFACARNGSRDPIFEAAGKILRIHNIQTFAKFANPLSISQLEHPSWHEFVLGHGTRQYAIGRMGSDPFFAKAPLSISKGKVMVRNGAEFLDLEDWIETLPFTAGPDIYGEAGYKMLDQWHKARKLQKQCPRINANVMDILLLHAIGEVRNVQNDSQGPTILRAYDFRHGSAESVQAWSGGAHISPRSIQNVNWRLLCLNKDTYERVQRLIRLHTTKSFTAPYILQDVLLSASTNFINSLTKVQLSFTDVDYFTFFGVTLSGCLLPRGPHVSNITADVLRNIPTLVYLELFFHSPLDQVRSNQIPWDFSDIPRSDMGGEVIAQNVPYQCRRLLVDYILCFAYRSISLVLKVEISGYVKTSTRDYWHRILRDKRNQIAHSKMVEERIKAIRKQPSEDS